MWTLTLLFAAGFVGGVLIAVAGGGSFVTFPALLFAGVPPITANASSTIALFPANMSSVWAFRREIAGVTEVDVKAFAAIGLVGSLLGAVALLVTPSGIFATLVPWLMLFATVVFVIGNFAPLGVIRRIQLGRRGGFAALFAISVYGGFFGGGVGFLILATLTLLGMRDIHAMNGLKLVLALLMTIVAIVIFIGAGIVDWGHALPMLVGSLLGGHLGAHGAKRVDQRVLKAGIAVLGAGLTVYFFHHGA